MTSFNFNKRTTMQQNEQNAAVKKLSLIVDNVNKIIREARESF